MSETNEWLSELWPSRPHVTIPIPDGTSVVNDSDRIQFCGLYPFVFIPVSSAIDFYTTQNVTPHARIRIKDIDATDEYTDVSNFVSSFGNISRKVDYMTGRMSPSSHSFTLMNSKDLGDWLFTLRKNFGADYWMNKEYEIDVCFYDSCKPEWINIYTGKIVKKSEDRIRGGIGVSSNDIIKELNDYKICTAINANDVFDFPSGTTDIRGFQQVVKYGQHKLILNGENKEKTERKDPFSVTLGYPNITSADWEGATSWKLAYNIWYFPFENRCFLNGAGATISQYKNDTLKVYYWDYINKEWAQFHKDDIENNTSRDIRILAVSGMSGFYLYMVNDVLTNTGITWSDYLAGTGAWSAGVNDIDPAICIESTSETATNDYNPVRIMFDILTSNNFINYDSSVLDYDNFTNVNYYTWDKSYSYFNGEGAEMNVSYDKETSIMNIIDEICIISGLSFFASRKKSDSEDRRIKLIENSPLNPNQYPLLEDQLVFSTKDKINNFVVTTDMQTLKNKIISFNFDSSTSTRESFDMYINEDIASGDIERTLQLGEAGSNVYFYNSGALSNAIGGRYLFQFKKPIELVDANFGKAGFEIEVGEIVDLHDAMSDETITGQVYNTNIDVKTAEKKFLIKRFPYQFGSDPEYPCRKWWFWDYAVWRDSECTSEPSSYHWY